jgi:VWFA-related protein
MVRLADSRELCAAAVLVVLVAGASDPAPAQEGNSRAEPPIIPAGTELVQVDAVVTDEEGRHVTDLTADDFEIVEDGKQRPIAQFHYVHFEPPPVAAGTGSAAPRTPPPKREMTQRTLVIVIDDVSLSFESQVRARTALHRFVDQRIGAGDLVQILRTGGGIGNLQQFTNDSRLLHAAVDGVHFDPAGREVLAGMLDQTRDWIDSPDRLNAAMSLRMLAFQQRMNLAIARVAQERRTNLTVTALDAIEQVVLGLERRPGRKSLLLVSEGIAVAGWNTDDRRVPDQMRRLLDAAHRAAVAFYAVDPLGLRTYDGRPGAAAAEQSQHAGLRQLADETGGLALLTSNDLQESLVRIDEDQRGYYLIGFEPDEARILEGDSGPRLHRIELRLKRRGLRVRSRRGFYARKDGPETELRATGLEGALVSPFPTVDVPLRLTPLFAHDAQRGSLVRCLLEIDADHLNITKRPDGDLGAEFDAGVATITASGHLAGTNTKAYSVQLTPGAADKARRDGLVLTLDVAVKPGPQQIRAAVWDERSNRGGSASEFLDVPDVEDGRLALSGVLMSGGDAAAAPVPLANPATPDAGMDPSLTSVVRRFPAGTSVTYAFAVYNARRARDTGGPRLDIRLRLYRDGPPVAEISGDRMQVSAPSPEAPVSVGGALHLGSDLEPGAYTLAVSASDAEQGGKDDVALRWTTFEVTGS